MSIILSVTTGRLKANEFVKDAGPIWLYVLNDAAYAYMLKHCLPEASIVRPAACPETRFADQAA